MFKELLTVICHFQQAIVFDILTQVTGNKCLTDHSIPRFVFFAHTRAEHFEIFMQMRLHFWSFLTLYYVYNIVRFKIFFHRENSFNHGTQ